MQVVRAYRTVQQPGDKSLFSNCLSILTVIHGTRSSAIADKPRCPSHGHISKTIQNRPIVTMEQLGITDSAAACRSAQDSPSLRRCLGFQMLSM